MMLILSKRVILLLIIDLYLNESNIKHYKTWIVMLENSID